MSTTPNANDTLAPTAANSPTASNPAPGRITTKATPSAATDPTASSSGRGRRLTTTHDSAATRSGCSPPAAAATPPGSRYTATASSGKNNPKLNTASRPVRRHSAPRGRQREPSAPTLISTTPAGSTRIALTSNGLPSGSNSVMTTYVVPHEIGASSVTTAATGFAPSDLFTFIILT